MELDCRELDRGLVLCSTLSKGSTHVERMFGRLDNGKLLYSRSVLSSLGRLPTAGLPAVLPPLPLSSHLISPPQYIPSVFAMENTHERSHQKGGRARHRPLDRERERLRERKKTRRGKTPLIDPVDRKKGSSVHLILYKGRRRGGRVDLRVREREPKQVYLRLAEQGRCVEGANGTKEKGGEREGKRDDCCIG